MPGKLKVLVGLMGLSIVLALIGQSWVSAIINILLLVGVLKGSEGVRNILMILAFIGLCFGAFALITSAALLLAAGPLGLIGLGGVAVSIAQNGFLLWCLTQQDVQAWMFHRSSGGVA